ncbi:MAG TPA: thiolase family protein [Solirubrobacterales bacterium]|nr:thiolase family protein [Solirubrobacterales bacterium]
MASDALIVGAFEARYERHAPPERSTRELLKEAVLGALADAGLGLGDVDGLGVASFSLGPDHAIDLAWHLGLSPRWLMEDPHGGASGLNLLAHAVRAIEAGDAETIVLCSGDHLDREAFAALVRNYNRVTAEHLAPLNYGGPNALFALLTERTMAARGLGRADLGAIPVAQRAWAGRNPLAVYREPLSMAAYLEAPPLAPPLSRLDCVPVVAGADAIVVTSRPPAGPAVRVRALRQIHNPDQQEGDGLTTGFARIADELWSAAGARPEDLDAAYLYDDYPVMVLAQALDLGLVPGGDASRWLRSTVLEGAWPLNTSGGQLSAGQAGAAGGMHGLVEAVRQLRGEVEEERRTGAELALVAGYGMVLYRHGASHNAAVLERVG